MKNHQAPLAYLLSDHQRTIAAVSDASSNSLVITSPGHMVQFYDADNGDFVHRTLREFAGTGLYAGHACIVIASREHIHELEGQLADAINQSIATGTGMYVALEVETTLAKIMSDDQPDWGRFKEAIGNVIADAHQHGELVRIYDGLVGALLQEDKRESAQTLEQFWHDLAVSHPFFVYRAYPRSTTHAGDTPTPRPVSLHHSLTVPSPGRLTELEAAVAQYKQAEEVLHMSEMRYRRLFETATDGILLVDASTLAIIDANPYAGKLLDCPGDQLVGSSIFSVRPFADNAAVQDEFAKLTKEQRLRYEATLTTNTGQCNEIEIIATPYSEGLAPIIQLSLRDITERKKAEQLEVRATGLLAEREHLMELNVAKDEFISLASHQLRTPATGVKQYIGMLLQGFMGDISEMQRIGLQKAYESNERQLKIVNDLLLVARVDAGKVAIIQSPCDIVQLIRDVASEQQDEIAARQQRIVLRLPRTLTVPADIRFLRMVLENLVTNASKYSYDGLPITISARRYSNSVHISVQDKGVGIRKNDLPKLYQKFSRIYNDRSTVVDGTGLGLYWSKKIIELHDGELRVRSKAGYGSTFTITLPLQ